MHLVLSTLKVGTNMAAFTAILFGSRAVQWLHRSHEWDLNATCGPKFVHYLTLPLHLLPTLPVLNC
jgi:hypothetical protein